MASASAQLSVMTSTSPLARSKRELSPNGLISCGQSVESSEQRRRRPTAILSGKRQKSFMRQRGRRRRRPTACCTFLSVWCVSQCTDAVSSLSGRAWCTAAVNHIISGEEEEAAADFRAIRRKNHHLTFWARKKEGPGKKIINSLFGSASKHS